MNDTAIAVCSADPGATPMMPYIGERTNGKIFTERAKYLTEAALLRCGFDIIDVRTPITDPQDAVMAANRGGADCTVIISYASFGSGRSFNDINGYTVEYAQGRAAKESRILAEDICSFMSAVKSCKVSQNFPVFSGAIRPTVTVNGGYLTGFDDAKLIYDPDHAMQTAERIAMGICENFGMPYLLPSNIDAYPPHTSFSSGKRGKKIKLLQALLSANGYKLSVDGIFGRNTELALKKFRDNNEIADVSIIETLLMNEHVDLHIGSQRTEVRYLQNKLRAKLYAAPLDGILQNDTIIALNAYLTDIGMTEITGKTAPYSAVVSLKPIGGGKPRLF